MHTAGQTNGYRPLPHGSLSETRTEAPMRTLTVDATTAEKLEGTSCAWGGCRPPSFSASVLSRSPTITSPLFHPFLFPPPLEYSCKRFGENLLGCPAKKNDTVSCKSWRGPTTLGPHNLQSWSGRVPRVPWRWLRR